MTADALRSLREALEYAPASGPVAPDLVGIVTPDGYFICAPCVGRIIARGCGHLLKEGRQVWRDRPEPHEECATCGA